MGEDMKDCGVFWERKKERKKERKETLLEGGVHV